LHSESLMICKVTSSSGWLVSWKNKISCCYNCSHFQQTPDSVPIRRLVTWLKQ
jgi:hypothetical protein